MPKRIREPTINFDEVDQDGNIIVEIHGKKYKWHPSEEVIKQLEFYINECDISIKVTVTHKFMLDISLLRTNKVIVLDEIIAV